MLLNQYELIYVTQPQLNATDLQGLSVKVSGFIEKAQGQVLAMEDWGRKKLAYPISKNEHGLYSYVNFVAPAEAPLSIERALGLDDSFMRYITVQLNKNVDVDAARSTAEAEKAERDAVRAAEEEAARLAAEAEAEEAAAAAAALAAREAAAAADAAAAAAAAAEAAVASSAETTEEEPSADEEAPAAEDAGSDETSEDTGSEEAPEDTGSEEASEDAGSDEEENSENAE